MFSSTRVYWTLVCLMALAGCWFESVHCSSEDKCSSASEETKDTGEFCDKSFERVDATAMTSEDGVTIYPSLNGLQQVETILLQRYS